MSCVGIRVGHSRRHGMKQLLIFSRLDPTQYTIIQKVTQEPHNSFAAPIFHTAYKFTFPLPNGNGAVAQTLDTFPLGEPTIRGSPALDFELSELFTLDPDAFSDFGFVSDDKSADLYGLEACLNADWRIYSPATSVSSEGFSDCQILPSSADIPLMVSRSYSPNLPHWLTILNMIGSLKMPPSICNITCIYDAGLLNLW